MKTVSRELGFGTGTAYGSRRMINQDGTFNVKRTGLPFRQSFHLFDRLISMPWWKFNIMVLLSYLLVNSLFAFLYMFIGVHQLVGITYGSTLHNFVETFFFSAQSLTTVGYGRISPIGFWASSVAALESMIGLLGFALVTGLLYGKFSRPVARILFSSKAVVAPYKDTGLNAVMFRLANEKSNQLIELEIQVMLAYEVNQNNKKIRKFENLKLEISKINFFPLPWTVVHPIDDQSPLYYYDEKDLEESKAEFIILLKAFDDIFAQTVYKRFSYRYTDIQWGARYQIIFKPDEDGQVNLMLDKINETETAELNTLPKYEEKTA